jgi:hypothetical protein
MMRTEGFVNRRSTFPSGHTTASNIKALLKYVEATKGSDAADEWLRAIHLARAELEDETRSMPIVTLHAALHAFVRVLSREDIAASWSCLIEPDVLGVWMRTLRGTASPQEAFPRLDGADSEYGRTTRWETIEAGPGFWRGRVYIAHDPALEEDGLLALQRTAELHVVPALFGFDRVTVAAHPASTVSSTMLVQDYEVRWPITRLGRAAGAGGAIGAVLLALPLALYPNVGTAMALLVSGCAGALLGAAWARDRTRRGETQAQVARVAALERGLLLRESPEREAAGDLVGSIVAGEYRIRQRMGAGASGVIYEAARASDGAPVAIKLLRAAAAHDVVASDRLRREAEALGLAWHPNVVEVIDHGHLADGTAYLVMELLRGESLATRLKSRLRLTPDELLPVALQVADALAGVHAAGVVHRDIKPSNIFICPTPNDGERIKLLDFGIARVEWEETRITNMGAPLGTAGYMSPEQESGGIVDARSDLFAFGAVLYECLTGDPPPAASADLWRQLASPLESGVQSIVTPPAWRVLVARALAPRPEDRFPDARAFAAALRALVPALDTSRRQDGRTGENA